MMNRYGNVMHTLRFAVCVLFLAFIEWYEVVFSVTVLINL